MFIRAAAFSMSFMRTYTGASGKPLMRAYREHLASISSRVICCQPKSQIAAWPGSLAFHPIIVLAKFSCTTDSLLSVYSSIGQKINECLMALKTMDFHMVRNCGIRKLCFAASCIIVQVRWLPILRKVLSNCTLRRLHCMRSPK